MKFVKGRKAGAGEEVVSKITRPIELSGKPAKQTENPWIAKRHFETVLARCTAAENMCKDLIRVIAVDDGEFLAGHDYDYLKAGAAILKGEI